MEHKARMNNESHLILARTPREQLKEGITVTTKGEGVRVFDQDGKSYLDLVSGVTRPVHVGYGRKEIAQAVYDQICELSYFTPMQFANIPAIKLANVLTEIAPGKIDKFFSYVTGLKRLNQQSNLPSIIIIIEERKSVIKLSQGGELTMGLPPGR